MLAADDGNPATMAAMHEVQIVWNKQQYSTMAPITKIAYHARGGSAPHRVPLPIFLMFISNPSGAILSSVIPWWQKYIGGLYQYCRAGGHKRTKMLKLINSKF